MAGGTSGRDLVPGFADRMKAMREAAGFSQEALARAAGTSSSSVAKLEREERAPSLRLAFAVADALGVTVDSLRDQPKKSKKGGPK